MAFSEVEFGFKLGPIAVGTKWRPNDEERRAAWRLLVQLGTRTTTTPLADDHGLIREALTSLYRYFDITRETLMDGGPHVAADKHRGDPSLATIAVLILNEHIRPLLSKWHPLLDDYEAGRPPTTGKLTWERDWPDHDAARADLVALREVLRNYLNLLGKAADAEGFANAMVRQIDG